VNDADTLVLTVGPPANGGACVARHDGRVVFVRGALPGERVRAQVTARRDAYWHAQVREVIAASPDRIAPLCPIAGPDGAGCCDLAFAAPEAARRLKAAVVANQLERLGGYRWAGEVQTLGTGAATGWRDRVRFGVGADGRAGLHRYRSDALVTDLRCAQLTPALVEGLADLRFPPGSRVHAVVDDDRTRHVVVTGRGRPRVLHGAYHARHTVAGRSWRLPVTAFWQAHRDAPARYSALVGDLAHLPPGATGWDLYGGAGLFAAALAAAVGESGRVLSVDTARAATGAARTALADLPQVSVRTDSVRRALARERRAADVAVLDPPRAGAGREVIGLLADAGVPRVIHLGCEAASFARDIGLYRGHGYDVEQITVFDAFPLTHHLEGVALLTR